MTWLRGDNLNSALKIVFQCRSTDLINPCCAYPDLTWYENSVYSDQLASDKPADQDPDLFSTLLVNTLKLTGILQVIWMEIGEERRT